MRTIKELLTVVKDNINRIGYDYHPNGNDETGLCSLIYRLYQQGKITETEWYIISDYFNNNLPANAIKRRSMTFPDSDFMESAFWFKPCARLPRYNYLVKHIKLNS